jgi:hypothetical protein
MGLTDVIGAAIVAGVLGGVLWFASRSGENRLKAKQGEENAKTASKIADAVAGSPRDDDELHKRLLDPDRKL